jgi:hypothetical protein
VCGLEKLWNVFRNAKGARPAASTLPLAVSSSVRASPSGSTIWARCGLPVTGSRTVPAQSPCFVGADYDIMASLASSEPISTPKWSG